MRPAGLLLGVAVALTMWAAAPTRAQTVDPLCVRFADQVIGTMRGAPVKATCDKVRALTDYAAQKKETPFAALREAVLANADRPFARWIGSPALGNCDRILLSAPQRYLCRTASATISVQLLMPQRLQGPALVDYADVRMPIRLAADAGFRAPAGVDVWNPAGELLLLEVLVRRYEEIAPEAEVYWADYPNLRVSVTPPVRPAAEATRLPPA